MACTENYNDFFSPFAIQRSFNLRVYLFQIGDRKINLMYEIVLACPEDNILWPLESWTAVLMVYESQFSDVNMPLGCLFGLFPPLIIFFDWAVSVSRQLAVLALAFFSTDGTKQFSQQSF